MDPLDWLPLLVVIIGAYATYFYAIRIEDKKRQYDLKVKVYFELLDLVNQNFSYKRQIYKLDSKEDKIDIQKCDETFLKNHKSSLMASLEDSKELYIKALENATSLILILSKLTVVGNKEVIEKASNFHVYISKHPKVKSDEYANMLLDLTSAIRRDLSGKKDIEWPENWWQFWK
jgi:hypothetical protein